MKTHRRQPRTTVALTLLIAVASIAGAFAASAGHTSAAQPDKAWLLVLNKTDNTMSIIDPATLQTVAVVPTGEAPHEVAASADGRLAFVANYGTGPKPGNTISVIDVAARKELRRVDLGPLTRPHGIVESAGKVFFTIEGSRAVARYDPAANRIDWLSGTGQNRTHMVVVSKDGKRLYTANVGSDTVTAIELEGAPKIAHIGVGKAPEGIAISPDGSEVWVGHNEDGGLSIIDTATNKVKETIKAGRMPIRVKFTPNGERVLVSDAQGGEVVVFDARTRKEIKRIPVPETPVGILITPDGRRAFVAATRGNKVLVIDLERLALSGTIQTGQQPDGMAWAGK
ncbi:MAG TPA: cytochrome D1 domain-containing protein [Blastocatellia bacterium]|nr:cytochrome D1 domain-containing protein [Blastocatellia bacterium]